MKTLIVNFSGRIGGESGNCGKIAGYIADKAGVDSEAVNISSININSCNKCEYECFERPENCRYISDDIVKLYDSILRCEYVYYIIPNYSDFPCSNYFAFRERGQCYFDDEKFEAYSKKKFKFIVVANTGHENIMSVISSDFPDVGKDDVLFLSSRAYGQCSIKGDLMSLESVREKIDRFVSPKQ